MLGIGNPERKLNLKLNRPVCMKILILTIAAASDSDSCAETVPDNENKTEEPKAIVAVPTPSEPPSVDSSSCSTN